MWQRILALVVKEFLTLFKDKQSRFVTIVPPLIQLVVFGYAASFDLNHVPYAVYDRDQGQAGRALMATFSGSPNFQLRHIVQRQDEIADLLDNREVLLVLQLEPRFSEKLAAGEPAQVQVLVDGRNSNTAQIAVNYAGTVIGSFNEQWIAQHGLDAPPAHLVSRAWFNPNLESRWFFIPGLVGLLTLVVTMVVTSLSVAREREQGTFDQLLVTPLRPFEILIGKATPGFVVGLAEGSLVILLAQVWFGVPLVGELSVLYLGLVLFLLAAIGIGLAISSLAVTLQQALLGGFLFLVPAVILSGFATPIANMPWAVQMITLLDPLRYFLIVLRGVFLEGTPLSILVHQLWPLALIAGCTLSAAAWLFRHRLY
ncbi:ABC transporter permease [Sedimenticola selenatireducens]|uniref:Antibiotic ABC transporter permease n=1 Tax=Sedimenticola selenatireducens TaxID=191960 RepID=A0A2N6CU79_9GAMM|nr:ABC transporter permease [Sedimenticola selenatireducens]PLX60723.1 MAG: antibiotic ABC transporter permease [Sedimenticola selenatireducens]